MEQIGSSILYLPRDEKDHAFLKWVRILSKANETSKLSLSTTF